MTFVMVRKYIGRSFHGTSTLMERRRMGMPFLLVPVLAYAIVSLSFASISKNTYANELAGNGLYDLFAAFRSSELDFRKFYVTRDDETVLAALREQLRERNNRFTSGDVHHIARKYRTRAREAAECRRCD
jgi:hypothetical protein